MCKACMSKTHSLELLIAYSQSVWIGWAAHMYLNWILYKISPRKKARDRTKEYSFETLGRLFGEVLGESPEIPSEIRAL